MLQGTRQEITAELEKAESPEEGCERYVDYALKHPWEYELFYQHDYELHDSPRSRLRGSIGRPAREVMKRKLQERLGDAAEDNERLLTALWMLAHGTAMLIIDKSITPEQAPEARQIFTASVKALLREAEFISKLQSED